MGFWKKDETARAQEEWARGPEENDENDDDLMVEMERSKGKVHACGLDVDLGDAFDIF
jgi:hypothetical protein